MKNCFARQDEICNVLTSGRCADKPCAFYKTKTQLSAERQRSYKRLKDMDRFDLFDKYDIPKE